MPRARLIHLFVLAAPVVAVTTACSLLVNFVDASCDSGSCADGGSDASDARSDVPEAAPFDASHICDNRSDGYYCGYNGLNGQAPPDWRVHCVDGGPIVRVCDAGCLAFPSGFPDRCNECPGFPDGTYCGSQFSGYGTYNANFLLSCGQGIAAIQAQCTNGCQEGPGDASCK